MNHRLLGPEPSALTGLSHAPNSNNGNGYPLTIRGYDSVSAPSLTRTGKFRVRNPTFCPFELWAQIACPAKLFSGGFSGHAISREGASPLLAFRLKASPLGSPRREGDFSLTLPPACLTLATSTDLSLYSTLFYPYHSIEQNVYYTTSGGFGKSRGRRCRYPRRRGSVPRAAGRRLPAPDPHRRRLPPP